MKKKILLALFASGLISSVQVSEALLPYISFGTSPYYYDDYYYTSYPYYYSSWPYSYRSYRYRPYRSWYGRRGYGYRHGGRWGRSSGRHR